jgi:hypothetical protein
MIQHVVMRGDCLSSIAKQHGFANWQTIYNHPSNSEFREKRPNPNIVYPGDVIEIPGAEDKVVAVQTGVLHSFRLIQPRTVFRILVEDIAGIPLDGAKYELEIEGATKTGICDGSVIEMPIADHAETGSLTVRVSEYESYIWDLDLGDMDPVETVEGQQKRLENLGYSPGEIDGLMGPMTKGAIEAFQADRDELDVDGICGPLTGGALEDAHGS